MIDITRPGKHTNSMENSACYSWVNPLFRLGHGFKFANCKRLPEGTYKPCIFHYITISYPGWWFQPTPLKNDGVSSSVGMDGNSQLFLERHSKFHGSSHHQPDILLFQLLTID